MLKTISERKIGFGLSGVFKSIYSGEIFFDSSYELFYLFMKDLEKKEVRRFDGYIEYKSDEKLKRYFPDFVIDNSIIEIKSSLFLKEGKFDKRKEIALKIDAAIDYKNKNGYDNYYLFLERDLNSMFEINLNDFKSTLYNLSNEGFIILNKDTPKWLSKKRRNKKGEKVYTIWKQLRLNQKK